MATKQTEIVKTENLPPQKARMMSELLKHEETQKALKKAGMTIEHFAKTLYKATKAKMPFKLKDGVIVWCDDNFNINKALEHYTKVTGINAPMKLMIDHHIDAELVITDERIARAKKAEGFDVIDAEVIPEEFVEDAE